MSYVDPNPPPGLAPTLSIAGYGRFSIVDALKPGAQTLKYVVLVSLYSWGRDSEAKAYGWWGAVVGRTDGTAWGSLLWRLWRGKMLKATETELKSTMETALAWMRSTGLVDRVEVSISRVARDRYAAQVTFVRGQVVTSVEFANLWEDVLAYAG